MAYKNSHIQIQYVLKKENVFIFYFEEKNFHSFKRRYECVCAVTEGESDSRTKGSQEADVRKSQPSASGAHIVYRQGGER